MKIKRNLIERMTIEDFAEKHDLTMVVSESLGGQFTAVFEGLESNVCYGQGLDEDSAIEAYASRLSRKTVCINGVSVVVPLLTTQSQHDRDKMDAIRRISPKPIGPMLSGQSERMPLIKGEG